MQLTRKSNTCDQPEQPEISDNSIGHEHEDSEQEFISAESTQQRPYQSAFREFCAEFEPPKRLHSIGEEEELVEKAWPDSNAIQLHDDSSVHLKTELEESETELQAPAPAPVLASPADPPEDLEYDDVTLYVKYLECKLKKYPTSTRNAIQFEFNRIIYEADLGLHDRTSAPRFS